MEGENGCVNSLGSVHHQKRSFKTNMVLLLDCFGGENYMPIRKR